MDLEELEESLRELIQKSVAENDDDTLTELYQLLDQLRGEVARVLWELDEAESEFEDDEDLDETDDELDGFTEEDEEDFDF